MARTNNQTKHETTATTRRPKPTPGAKLNTNKRSHRETAETNAERKALSKLQTPAQAPCQRRHLEKGRPSP